MIPYAGHYATCSASLGPLISGQLAARQSSARPDRARLGAGCEEYNRKENLRHVTQEWRTSERFAEWRTVPMRDR